MPDLHCPLVSPHLVLQAQPLSSAPPQAISPPPGAAGAAPRPGSGAPGGRRRTRPPRWRGLCGGRIGRQAGGGITEGYAIEEATQRHPPPSPFSLTGRVDGPLAHGAVVSRPVLHDVRGHLDEVQRAARACSSRGGTLERACVRARRRRRSGGSSHRAGAGTLCGSAPSAWRGRTRGRASPPAQPQAGRGGRNPCWAAAAAPPPCPPFPRAPLQSGAACRGPAQRTE